MHVLPWHTLEAAQQQVASEAQVSVVKHDPAAAQ
tara:strand:+ start:355 stop:456 length:102 start_codon:yes stop_codon:yes gene_type:complete